MREIESAEATAADAGRRDELRRIGERQAKEARINASAATMPAQALFRRLADQPELLDSLSPLDLLKLALIGARSHHRAIVAERLALGMTTEQPGEPTARDDAAAAAARMTDDELDARLGVVDELGAARDRRRDREAAREAASTPSGGGGHHGVPLRRRSGATPLDRLLDSDPANNPNNEE
ncbi:hypothetical protein [Baekduia sp.]|uniref:hypothetical protein n=1 Tax=Baekduia sp. TaxID=2600305 RepID=UPI002DF9E52E|nr:hypothetical protein [Baekduia sp.]